MEIRINRENQKCVNSLNTLTDENYRGKGIFSEGWRCNAFQV